MNISSVYQELLKDDDTLNGCRTQDICVNSQDIEKMMKLRLSQGQNLLNSESMGAGPKNTYR